MAEPVKEALVSLGQRVRVYTPYGELLPGMAYLVRRLLENTANESFLRASFTEHVPEEQLLMNPLERAERASAGALSAQQKDEFQNEPLSDFSKEEARAAMKSALDTVRANFGGTYALVINGSYALVINESAVSGQGLIDSVNPSHMKATVGRCAKASVTQAGEPIPAPWQALHAR